MIYYNFDKLIILINNKMKYFALIALLGLAQGIRFNDIITDETVETTKSLVNLSQADKTLMSDISTKID